MELLNLLKDAIFTGTWIAAIILLMIHVFKINLRFPDKPTLTRAVNIALLLGSFGFILWLITGIFTAYYSGGEYEQYDFSNRLILPYWWYFAVWLFGYGLLPQIMWFRRLRRSFIGLIIIVTFWGISNLFWSWGSSTISTGWFIKVGFSVFDYLKQLGVYFLVVFTV